MSTLNVSALASPALPGVHFQGHKKGAKGPAGVDTESGSIGQLPLGTGQSLLQNAVKSLQAVAANQPRPPLGGNVDTSA